MGWFVSFLQLRAERASPSNRTLGKVLVGRRPPWNPVHPAASTRGACEWRARKARARGRSVPTEGERTQRLLCRGGAGGAAADGAEKRPRAELRADPPPRRSQTRTQRRGRPRPRRGRSPIGGGSEPIVDSGRLRSLRWSPPIGPRAAPVFAYFVARK